MEKNTSAYYLYGAAALVVVGLLAFAVTRESAPSPYDGFAQCLSDSGIKMYGAWWCPHCQNQKKLFGNSFDFVIYVECSNADKSMNQTCQDAGIEGYPTWELDDGTRLGGEQSLETLAEQSGCKLPATE
ncbi:hypothetical protein HZA87_04675 [Candidatus Uhrbacteria bacterium]|nr:hypothetical protein [Candidatus Uhrbacteria bacterium]